MALTLKGVSGSIRWGYFCAATVGPWSIAPAKPGPFTLSAALGDANAYQLTQRPLTFVVSTQGGSWTWPVLSLTVTGRTLNATLGPLGSKE